MYEIIVIGIVQGVGFRPFIYNKAIEYNVSGFVQNIGGCVRIVSNNKNIMLDILKNPPMNSKIDCIQVKKIDKYENCLGFIIKKSVFNKIKNINNNISNISIPSDLSVCDECLIEMRDETNFRYRYFAISCINCGPRFSIVDSLPYDRSNTSFEKFYMCDKCVEEYENPSNRRYHAQSIGCDKCGPMLTLYKKGCKVESYDVIKLVTHLIEDDNIVAIKGVGGFHLVCNINLETIKKLRKLTNRDYKPFVVMGSDIGMIEKYVSVTQKEKDVLTSIERPIVLLDKLDRSKYSFISELGSLGFLLPYTPLHYLLFDYLDKPIILTSSNMPGFPISIKKEEQFVDYVLDYNRDIVNFSDDSIVKVVDDDDIVFIRKSRGYSPMDFNVPSNYRGFKFDVFGVGSELKNTFCVKKDDKLILSQHVGNTNNLENFENYKIVVDRFLFLNNVKPKVVLSDMNKSFNVSKFAKEFIDDNGLDLNSLVKVQHHIAHGFGVAFEYNLDDFISIVCDGVGLGNNGEVWGGEVCHNDKRIGSLERFNLVGGDIANKEPVRMLVSVLSNFMDFDSICCLLSSFDKESLRIFYKQNKENFNCVKTSSCGRVLDCVSILLGFSDKNYYEGRGAMMLESNCSEKVKMFIESVIDIDKNGLYVLRVRNLFEFIIDNIDVISKDELARFAHVYIAKGLYEIVVMYMKKIGEKLPVCFSGGVVANSIITKFMLDRDVLINEKNVCGDGGISVGQIAYFLWKNKGVR